MGRFPWVAYVNRYLERLEKNPEKYAPKTLVVYRTMLRYLGRTIHDLYIQGRASTENPTKMTEDDMRELLTWMRNEANGRHGLDKATQRRYIVILKGFLTHCNNPVLERMRQEGSLPQGIRKEIVSLTGEELERLLAAAQKVEGWRGTVLRFLLAVHPFTGLRSSELRLAQIEDIDTNTWTLWVRHPKGEKRYGVKRTVPILPPARPYVETYLRERSALLRNNGVPESQCPQLIPHVNSSEPNKTSFYADNTFRQLKREVERMAGVRFKLKDLRSTYAQTLKDRGATIETISKLMGHSNTATTERYYARIRDLAAFEEVNRLWETQSPQALGAKNPMIGAKNPKIENRNAPPIYQ